MLLPGIITYCVPRLIHEASIQEYSQSSSIYTHSE
jgi:hypothetical protein